MVQDEKTHTPTLRQQGLDALRIQAEIETADRSTTKRPTWAPAIVLDGELLKLCRELEFLKPDDKPVARLWAVFADPKREGAAVRTTFSRHVLPGVRCRGFEMRAGTKHNGHRMTNALMSALGSWNVGHLYWRRSNIDRLHRRVRHYESRIEGIHQILAKPPWVGQDLAHCIERLHKDEADAVVGLEKLRQDIFKAETRHKALTRMTELATLRLVQFTGDPQVERTRGSQLTGSCCICGKTLTDKISLERGIGPECIQNLRTFDCTDLVRLKEAMVAAHPDKGGRHEAFIEAYDRYVEAKSLAERRLTY